MRRPRAIVVAVFVAGAMIAGLLVLRGGSKGTPLSCIYTRQGVAGLRLAASSLQVPPDCALVFDGAPIWASWANPWFLGSSGPNSDWAGWVRSDPSHRLIADVDLIPSQLTGDPSWRSLGAQGAYVPYAKALASALVHAGLGHAFVRLGNEANGNWENDWIGTTPTSWMQWRRFWRLTVQAMRSVPGAHFRFIWCISEAIGHVPFAAYYPGNDVVDVIGVDIYDAGFTSTSGDRWTDLVRQPLGVRDLVRFANRMHKPVAVPEWGLIPSAQGGGGDDPRFVRGVASLSKQTDLVLQSYFDAGSSASALSAGPNSLAAYRDLFAASHR